MPLEPEGPAAPAAPTPAPAEPTPAKPQAGLVPAPEQTRGVVGVWVPAQARVVINGLETTSTGRYREYVSHGLKPGAVYKYEIRAQIARDGRLIEKTQTVYLTGGVRQRVAFHFEAKPEEAIAALW
ncbi:MAG TPA: TIGR03000 domain-containing protein [Thermoguttaceae bacterium]|nr:TIGR03000 domain-containing protein [Thermoguttaceae bacterium]